MQNRIITGRTTDGTPTVFARLFQWKDQEGLPLDITANIILKNGYVTDWLYEVEGALWIGYTQERILEDLNETFQMLHPGYHKELLNKVKQYFVMRETPNQYTFKALKLTKP